MSYYFLCSQNKDSINRVAFQMLTAKQNQKFPFHFLSAPPTPPAENQKLRKENFWFLLPRPQGADEARDIRAYDSISHHHTLRACEVITSLCFGNRCEFGTIQTQQETSAKMVGSNAYRDSFSFGEIRGGHALCELYCTL